MAHAYYLEASRDSGLRAAVTFAEEVLGLSSTDPDFVVFNHFHFSVENARDLFDVAHAAPAGKAKVIVISVARFFHEAQNALLKLFEEPPTGVTLILIVPSTGILIPTLRSRLAKLPVDREHELSISEHSREFIHASDKEREELVKQLLERTKSDNDTESQDARIEARRLVEDLLRLADKAQQGKGSDGDLRAFIEDLSSFLPLFHSRAVPHKQIFEHLLLVIPKGL